MSCSESLDAVRGGVAVDVDEGDDFDEGDAKPHRWHTCTRVAGRQPDVSLWQLMPILPYESL